MKTYLYYLALLLSAAMVTSASCDKADTIAPTPTAPPVGNSGWLIPQDRVFDGGPGKDGIPSVDAPNFSLVDDISFLNPNDLVLGIKVGEEIRAYPHPILDWHEIVNDELEGQRLAITYCPLTGSGSAWVRDAGNSSTTFGVSGLLYNTNLLPYDRETDSNWSQMLLKAVNGPRIGQRIETVPMVETSWQTWKAMYPGTKVMNTNTGFNRSYGSYPYGDYRSNHNQMIFPISPDDARLPRKQRGLGIIVADDKAKFYPINQFAAAAVVAYHDTFEQTDLVVVGSEIQNFVVAFERKLEDGTLLDFTAIEEIGNPHILRDQEGNEWNIFGEALVGPRQGTRLQAAEGLIAYWLAWGAFYPGLEIFQP